MERKSFFFFSWLILFCNSSGKSLFKGSSITLVTWCYMRPFSDFLPPLSCCDTHTHRQLYTIVILCQRTPPTHLHYSKSERFGKHPLKSLPGKSPLALRGWWTSSRTSEWVLRTTTTAAAWLYSRTVESQKRKGYDGCGTWMVGLWGQSKRETPGHRWICCEFGQLKEGVAA